MLLLVRLVCEYVQAYLKACWHVSVLGVSCGGVCGGVGVGGMVENLVLVCGDAEGGWEGRGEGSAILLGSSMLSPVQIAG